LKDGAIPAVHTLEGREQTEVRLGCARWRTSACADAPREVGIDVGGEPPDLAERDLPLERFLQIGAVL
jgi:hypothetical protein